MPRDMGVCVLPEIIIESDCHGVVVVGGDDNKALLLLESEVIMGSILLYKTKMRSLLTQYAGG
jgi:hypothetical protein